MTSGSRREYEKMEQHGRRRGKCGTARWRLLQGAECLGLVTVSLDSETGLFSNLKAGWTDPLILRESRISQAVSASLFQRQGGKQKK